MDAALTQQIAAVFAPWDKPNSPGCCVGIIQEDELTYARGFGRASLEHDLHMDETTVFDVASVSKQFTAACVAIEIEAGRLHLDDDIRQFIPELPIFSQPVQIHHLLHHTSGWPDYLDLLERDGMRAADFVTPEEVLTLLGQQASLDFIPGDRYAYSNTGYFLLGVIIERISGTTLADYAHQAIFEPLNMTSTWFQDDYTRVVPRRATGYSLRKDGLFHTDMTTLEIVGDGALLTCMADLLQWDRNFYANRLGRGRPSLIELMLMPGSLNDGSPIPYGFGLDLTPYQGHRCISHSGWFVGYRAEMMRLPDQKLTIICLANTSALNPIESCRQVAAILLGSAADPVDTSESRTAFRIERAEAEQTPDNAM